VLKINHVFRFQKVSVLKNIFIAKYLTVLFYKDWQFPGGLKPQLGRLYNLQKTQIFSKDFIAATDILTKGKLMYALLFCRPARRYNLLPHIQVIQSATLQES